ncbi:hypothetical protein K2173_013199 [Erythroxylum novogranatense]|uniref:Pentatricopeptide repeat-containing protein n=1 Tax=Erythroxylum novogranatense TaxID=1862640 RepID=A0AAV8TF44_9ROSI|nr:hypothetical protein K2173_013199 [Erythroxylum novogranatense]
MFLKLQYLDTNCSTFSLPARPQPTLELNFHELWSLTPFKKYKVLETVTRNGAVTNLNGVIHKHLHEKTSRAVVVREPKFDNQRSEKNPDGEPSEPTWDSSRTEGVKKSGKEIEGLRENVSLGNVRAKCSMKYGGCIPLILQALDTVQDLDEAFRPWEDTLSNKERSIILKEQSSWERAVEIFEWFKRKGCYELNVIHYNIMLRILGKARKWEHVESLWYEMCDRGISPVNSTYGTLIDVYSKGGLRKEAACWLETMKCQGMEPDEVTMGTVVQMYKKAGEFQKAEKFFKRWSLREHSKHEGTPITIAKGEEYAQVNVSLSSHTYNTLIDTYGKAGQQKEASETFGRMLREGLFQPQ